jgi:hypothetical protein
MKNHQTCRRGAGIGSDYGPFGFVPDLPPAIALTEEPTITARKTIRFAYEISTITRGESICCARRSFKPVSAKTPSLPKLFWPLPAVIQDRGAAYAD